MDKILELSLILGVCCFLSIYPVICQDSKGIFPYVLNLASRAQITTNATCGENEPEVFCKLVEHVQILPAENRQCDMCDSRSNLTEQRHPIRNAIDGSNRWWQSPTLTNGREFNFITVTLDLRQVYQVAYVIVKAANSPRPGNWILEKSIDGITYFPWQYFAIRKRDCRNLYGLRATVRIPSYLRDDEVICTPRYSKLNPLENGEIFVSLVNGRPGVRNPSSKLLEFTSARYVRIRLQKIRTLNADLMTFRTTDPKFVDPSVTRRYYYSLKDISIGGQCICYGHAGDCKPIRNTDRLSCECVHNTCGNNCEKCCPLYNQKPWKPGTEGVCEECNCHGHAEACIYNATVDAAKRSLNVRGEYEGGGVCLNCQDFTTGVNCEKCIEGYYRPLGVLHTSRSPCRQCRCRLSIRSTGKCVVDDSRIEEGLNPGDCLCKQGFGGRDCQKCAFGYYGYPNCRPCPCNAAGSQNSQNCEGRCVCKTNVEGHKCDRCKPGYYNMDKENPDGCSPCFCFGVSNACQSSGLGIITISDMRGGMDGWTLTSLGSNGFTLFPNMNSEGWLEYNVYPSRNQNMLDPMNDETIYYWQAPLKYLGSKLSSYGGNLIYTIKYTKDRQAPFQQYHYDIDVIIQSGNLTISSGKNYLREDTERKRKLKLLETKWFKLEQNRNRLNLAQVSKKEFMTILFNVDRLLIRASYHSAQKSVYLRDVVLESVSAASSRDVTLPTVEKCACPPGYTGLSCESCGPGYRRMDNQLFGGKCVGCNCYGHSDMCDHITGRCLSCQHFTTGINCDECLPGYYGDPRRGTPNDCKPCACPLVSPSNNFASRCRLKPVSGSYDNYECLDCRQGYTGLRCERCAIGYYGNPTVVGSYCSRCECNGNIDINDSGSCNVTTGICLKCLHNTEGDRCDRCRTGYFGTGVNRDCTACDCDLIGSVSSECDRFTGRCPCKDKFGGRRCDQCQSGYGNVEAGCTPCECNRIGSLDLRCNRITGQCPCRSSIVGLNCDRCQDGYYGFSLRGCLDCSCDRMGTNQTNQCNNITGICNCLPNVIGRKCDTCQNNYWGLPLGGGCQPCNCNPTGSTSLQCDRRNGQCPCRSGIGGKTCDQCLPGFYGFSVFGCKRCQPCTKPGYICDENTGECRCPPNTIGTQCERCAPNSWGYDPLNGCKRCGCNPDGSLRLQCDLRTGQCQCKLDYTGDRCDLCQFGYYNFPSCRQCSCNVNGTEPSSCNAFSQCQCQNNGQCNCKENVIGKTCSACKDNSFSLTAENPFGCTTCFCFERSTRCTQAPAVLTRISLPDATISFDARVTTSVMKKLIFYNVIPDNSQWASIPSTVEPGPTYWKLPRNRTSPDMTLSYNGRLRYTITYRSSERTGFEIPAPDEQPEVVIIGNGFHMVYNDNTTWVPNSQLNFNVLLHPSKWKVIGFDDMATRKLMMIVLENVTAVLVRATYDEKVTYAELKNVELDVASITKAYPNSRPFFGIEMCVCPARYSGLSCQDPSDGYYKIRFNNTTDISDPIRVIGDVRECNCYGHSDICDSETGACQNCNHNTTGMYCNRCVPGFYGDATRGTRGDCRPCACPLATNNPTCEVLGGQIYCINCTDGYTGNRCEICERGYYGNPSAPGGKCTPCMCNPQGSVNTQCDYRGQCTCLPGITGTKCNSCQPRHAVVNGICTSCDKGCTRDLMLEMDHLENMTVNINLTGIIPVPWDRLWRIKNDTIRLRAQLPILHMGNLGDRGAQTKNLTDLAENLLIRSEILDGKGDKTVIDAAVLKNNATKLADEIEELFKNLRDEISKLEDLVEKLFHNKTGANITASLEQVKEILREIESRNHTMAEQKAFNESMLAEKLSERILAMKLALVNTSVVDVKIKDIQNRLMDLQRIANETVNNATRAARKNLNVALRKQSLEDKFIEIDIANDDVTQLLGDGLQLNQNALRLLNESRINLKNFERHASILDVILPNLQSKTDDLASKLPGAENLTRLALEHATNLSIYANLLEKMFEKAKADAQDPLRAAMVFDNIIKAVNEAEEAAKRAKKAAEDSIRIAGVDDIRDKVANSLNRSRHLLKRANRTYQGIPALDNELKKVKFDLIGIENTQNRANGILSNIKFDINGLPTDIGPAAQRVAIRANDVDLRVRGIKDKVDRVLTGIDNDMDKLRYLQNVNLEGTFNSIDTSVDIAKNNFIDIKALIGSVEALSNRTKLAASRISNKLLQLKDNIRKARSQADKVKVSLSANGNCARSYRGNIRPGPRNSLSFSFKTNSTAENMLIILIQSPSSQEFLAVDMVGGKIRFVWDVGSGVGIVENRLNIQNEGNFINEKDKWYQVKVDRVGRLGILKIYPVANANAGLEVSGGSPVVKSILDVDHSANYFIGGTPQGYNRPLVLAKGNFKGCLADVYFDQTSIGLHNFKSTEGRCWGCREAPRVSAAATDTFNFDGTGHAEYPQVASYQSDEFFIKFSFKTAWDNATLLFSGNKDSGDFIYIGLLNGKMNIQYFMGGDSFSRIELKGEYNDNTWHRVRAQRINSNGFLQVDKKPVFGSAPGGNTGLELKNRPIYFGGVPEIVDLSPYRKFGQIEETKFLGCIKQIQIAKERNLNLLKGDTSGVQEGCREEGFRTIGFYGSGFAQYDGTSLGEEESDISLSFRTTQNNALLLLATDEDQQNYYSLAIVDGKVEGRFSGSSLPVTLMSSVNYNDGHLHNVAVRKVRRKLEMYVDDELVDDGRLPQGTLEIIVTQMFIGGVPRGFADGQLTVATVEGLSGCINDILITGNVVNLNSPKQYDRADIGRCTLSRTSAAGITSIDIAILPSGNGGTNPLPPTTQKITTAVATKPTTTYKPPEPPIIPGAPTSCAQQNTYALNPDALTLGDRDEGFAEVRVDEADVSVSFDVTFDFRTYYDGIFFYLTNKDQTEFLVTQLLNGRVVIFYYDQQDGFMSVNSTVKVSDGQWHSVVVRKGTKRIRLQVDNGEEIRENIKRKLNIVSPMYVGGYPQGLQPHPEVVNHSMRGCLRNFELNNNVIKIENSEVISGVSQCFQTVEPGVYLTGYSYGVYSQNFKVGEGMTVSLEFRTHKPNGVFLTISDPGGFPAMTLELNNGKVKMSARSSEDKFTAETTNNPYSLCDNKWHRIKASVIKNVVSVSVDDTETAYGSSGGSQRFSETNSPLFIGGFKASFPQGAAFTDEGFEGCLRNFVIDNDNVEWYQLVSSQDLYKSACPVA